MESVRALYNSINGKNLEETRQDSLLAKEGIECFFGIRWSTLLIIFAILTSNRAGKCFLTWRSDQAVVSQWSRRLVPVLAVPGGVDKQEVVTWGHDVNSYPFNHVSPCLILTVGKKIVLANKQTCSCFKSTEISTLFCVLLWSL